MYKIYHLGYFFLLFVIVISSFSIKTVVAGTGKSVVQGGSATINWAVANAPNCTGTTDYPNGDGIRTSWQDSVRASGGNLNFATVSAAPGTYTFTCVHRDINGSVVASDSAILTVTGGAPAPAASCSANITLNWNPACSAYYNNTISSGSSVTVNNTASGYTGSQTYSCTNGTWGFVNESCNANPPASGTPPVGYLDSVSSGVAGSSCGMASGWAYDPDASSQSIEVHVYRDGPAGTGVGSNTGATSVVRPSSSCSNDGKLEANLARLLKYIQTHGMKPAVK